MSFHRYIIQCQVFPFRSITYVDKLAYFEEPISFLFWISRTPLAWDPFAPSHVLVAWTQHLAHDAKDTKLSTERQVHCSWWWNLLLVNSAWRLGPSIFNNNYKLWDESLFTNSCMILAIFFPRPSFEADPAKIFIAFFTFDIFPTGFLF